MALTIGTLDSWTATVNTERTLDAVKTTDGIYQASIDMKNHAAGDTTEIRCYLKVDTGETEQLYDIWTVQNVLPAPLVMTPPITCHGASVKFSVKQTAGTGRAFKRRIIQLA